MKLKKAGIITKLLVLAMIIYASVTLIGMRAKIEAAIKEQKWYRMQVEEKQTTNADLQYKIDHKDDKDIIADVARNDLKYVAPGEKVFYDTGN
jgi:cell division protein FtsB